MSYMRIAADTIQKRGQEKERGVWNGYGYYFTNSKWQAMAYMSDRLIVEDRFVDPHQVFPARATKSMKYGERHGLIITAMQYRNAEGKEIGALAMVESGEHVLGFYVVKYGPP